MLLPPASTEDRLPAVTNRLLYLLLLLANWMPLLAPASMEDRLHDFRALGGEESVAVVGDDLFVYYGGADSVTCVAMANLDTFLNELKIYGAPKLKTNGRS